MKKTDSVLAGRHVGIIIKITLKVKQKEIIKWPKLSGNKPENISFSQNV